MKPIKPLYSYATPIKCQINCLYYSEKKTSYMSWCYRKQFAHFLIKNKSLKGKITIHYFMSAGGVIHLHMAYYTINI